MKTPCKVAKPFRYGGEMREVGETVDIETRFVRALSGLGKIEAKKRRGRPPKVKEAEPAVVAETEASVDVAMDTEVVDAAGEPAEMEPKSATYQTKDMKAE